MQAVWRRASARKLCAGALLIAVGVLLPQLFHLIGGPAAGGMFLPMHIPVLISGLLLGQYYGSSSGVLSPVISFLIMGMPAAARLPFMVVELAAYGFFSGLFRGRNLYFRLLMAQIAGRLAYALAVALATYVLGVSDASLATVWTAVLAGLPGIVVQIVLVPALVLLINKVVHFDRTACAGKDPAGK